MIPQNYHTILFPYAYNILGSVEDAKDAVQDVLANYISSKTEDIENQKGYLTKSVINQSINIKKKRKRISKDVWLPEPIATEESDTNINLRDIVSYSLLVLLEQLNPKERAVFILKEAFSYSHEEISEVLSGTVEQSRKLLSRAKSKLNPAKQSSAFAREKTSKALVEKYINAIRDRDTKALENLLSTDITFYADGGNKVQVVQKRCVGIAEVMDLILFVYHKYNASSSIVITEVNHQPALLYYNDDILRVCQVFSISLDNNRVQQINTVVDPDKLKNINTETSRGKHLHSGR